MVVDSQFNENDEEKDSNDTVKDEQSTGSGTKDSRDDHEYADDKSDASDTASVARDIETGPSEVEKGRATSTQTDRNVVSWNNANDPTNPKNWSKRDKWVATFMAGAFTLISPIASSMCAPALHDIGNDFNIANAVESQLVLSIFVLAYAFGPLFLGPLSELFGRVVVLQSSNAFFAIFNLACGFAQTKEQMIIFRFLAGMGGSAPLAIGGAIIGDCWRTHERGKAVAIFSLMPLLATAVGPIAGGFVTQHTTWRWIFWSITIASSAIQVLGFLFLRETFAPEILRLKKAFLVKKTGNQDLYTEFEANGVSTSRHIKRALVRPFRLLFTQPIVQFMAIYIAYVYGLIYLVMSTFPSLWSSSDYYEESISIGGLNYISLALGYVVGSQVSAFVNDRIYHRLREGNNNVGRSEFRIPLMVPSSLIMPIGLFWYGWTAETHQHWILPNIGAFLFALGGIVVFQCIQTYLVDAYTHYAASALAAAVVLRSLCGFAYPLFAPYMYSSLGYGWGNSVLGLVAIIVGLPAPIILWRHGEALRARSRFCANS